jgi:hypothetical protein
MPVANNIIAGAIVSRITENIARGKTSRETLGMKLAEMPPREIAKLPRSVLMRIGPEGIATMARVAAGTDDALPAARRVRVPREHSNNPKRAPLPLWQLCGVAALLVILLTIIGGAIERPLRWAIARTGYMTGQDTGLCNRLDRWSEDCDYVVNGPGLSLAEIEARLALKPNSLNIITTNMQAGGVLPAGTIIHVNRNSRK